MKQILVLAPSPCLPPNTGSRLRNFHLARLLSRYARVVFLAFDGPRSSSPARFEPGVPFEIAQAPERGSAYRLRDIVQGAIGQSPFTVLNWTRPAMGAALDRLLATHRFDVVQIASIQMAGYLGNLRAAQSRPTLVCDWHNIESEILHRYAETAGVLRAQYARLTERRLVEFERRVILEVDAHLGVSERDCEHLRHYWPQARVFEVPNGIDLEYYDRIRNTSLEAAGTGPGGDRIVFVGSMDYTANVDAVCRFVHSPWRAIRHHLPHLVFTIVGRHPTRAVRALASVPGVEVTGTVTDVRPYLAGALALVVPLRVAGGTRLKILEAMAAGVPVISTSIGAEGLSAQHGRELIVVQHDDEFVAAVRSLSSDRALRARLTANARSLIESKYDWRRIGDDLWNIYERLQARESPQAPVDGYRQQHRR